MYVSDGLHEYRRSRTAFSAKVYGLLILWLILAFIQWIVVCFVEDARSIFKKYYYVSVIAFAVAVLLLTLFIFSDGVRFMQCLNLIISLIIVELQVVATFVLIALSWWADVIVFFVVTAVVLFLFLLIGILLPRRMDLTLDIAVLFIIAFIFLIVAVFALALLMNLWFPKMYTYLVVELAVTLTILMFVIYHAQTIHGNRFAEMRLNDFFLGSLILFHDFLIIFWLTFYWQIQYRPITPDSWMASSNAPKKNLMIDDYHKDWNAIPLETVFTEQAWDHEYGGSDVTVANEDQDEDSSQHRQVTKKRVSVSRGSKSRGSKSRASVGRASTIHGKDRRHHKKHGTRTTPLDWAVFKATTTAGLDTQDEPAQEIQKNPESQSGYRSPGVLYKVKPIYGSNLPVQANENTDTDTDTDTDKYKASARPATPAKEKQTTDLGKPLEKFYAPNREWDDYLYTNDESGDRPKEKQVNPGKPHQEDKTGAENPNLRRTAQPQPNREVMGQEELKSLSDSKILRGKEKSLANPRAEPLSTTNSFHVQQIMPNFRKLVMNNTSFAN